MLKRMQELLRSSCGQNLPPFHSPDGAVDCRDDDDDDDDDIDENGALLTFFRHTGLRLQTIQAPCNNYYSTPCQVDGLAFK